MKARRDVKAASPIGGEGAAIRAWAADECSNALEQGLSGEEDKLHGDLARDAKQRGLVAWKRFDVFKPVKEGYPSEAVLDISRALTWKVVEGEKVAEARLVESGGGVRGSGSEVWLSGNVVARQSRFLFPSHPVPGRP